jgi:hypothetical protein
LDDDSELVDWDNDNIEFAKLMEHPTDIEAPWEFMPSVLIGRYLHSKFKGATLATVIMLNSKTFDKYVDKSSKYGRMFQLYMIHHRKIFKEAVKRHLKTTFIYRVSPNLDENIAPSIATTATSIGSFVGGLKVPPKVAQDQGKMFSSSKYFEKNFPKPPVFSTENPGKFLFDLNQYLKIYSFNPREWSRFVADCILKFNNNMDLASKIVNSPLAAKSIDDPMVRSQVEAMLNPSKGRERFTQIYSTKPSNSETWTDYLVRYQALVDFLGNDSPLIADFFLKSLPHWMSKKLDDYEALNKGIIIDDLLPSSSFASAKDIVLKFIAKDPYQLIYKNQGTPGTPFKGNSGWKKKKSKIRRSKFLSIKTAFAEYKKNNRKTVPLDEDKDFDYKKDKCPHCDRVGHLPSRCYKKYPELKNKERDEMKQFKKIVAKLNPEEIVALQSVSKSSRGKKKFKLMRSRSSYPVVPDLSGHELIEVPITLEEKFNLVCEVDSGSHRPVVDKKFFEKNILPSLDKSAFKGYEEVFWVSETTSQKTPVYEIVFTGPNGRGLRCKTWVLPIDDNGNQNKVIIGRSLFQSLGININLHYARANNNVEIDSTPAFETSPHSEEMVSKFKSAF